MESFNIKSKPAVKYFEAYNINQFFNEEENKSNQNEKVQIDFNLINGKINNIYGIRLVNPDKDSFDDSFLTNMKTCTNSKYLNLLSYSCDYIFGKEQKLKFELMIKQKDGFHSHLILTTIGEIVGKENSTAYFDIKGLNEKLELKAKTLKTKMKYLTILFYLDIVSSSNEKISEMKKEEYLINEKYKLYFKIENNNMILYESEAFTDDGKFNIVQIPLTILNSDFSILLFNFKDQNIGRFNTTVSQITHPNEKNKLIFQQRLSQMDYLNIYNKSSIKDGISFLNYIKNGVRIALDIGIDFTGSNGHPDDEGTLHCRLPNEKQRNPYERAILSCAKIMANYDYDQLFPVYGFGAVIKGQRDTSMCFNINFKEDPNIQFVDNIIKEYYSCLDKIYFSGPTFFAPIINKIIQTIKNENDPLEYHVLMILTDGKIEDFEETVDALVEGSFLPLSVIIVGIGDNQEDFTFMEQLDADVIPLISSSGKKRQRDLVQFVPFNKFEGDEKKLTEEVLDEIPRQIIEYYTLNFLYPESLSKINNNKNINSNNNNSYNNNNGNYDNNGNNNSYIKNKNYNNYGISGDSENKFSVNNMNNMNNSISPFQHVSYKPNNKKYELSSDFQNYKNNNYNFNSAINNQKPNDSEKQLLNSNRNTNKEYNYTPNNETSNYWLLNNSNNGENGNINYNPYLKRDEGKNNK